MEDITQEDYEQLAADVQAGKHVVVHGRSARSLDELHFAIEAHQAQQVAPVQEPQWTASAFAPNSDTASFEQKFAEFEVRHAAQLEQLRAAVVTEVANQILLLLLPQIEILRSDFKTAFALAPASPENAVVVSLEDASSGADAGDVAASPAPIKGK